MRTSPGRSQPCPGDTETCSTTSGVTEQSGYLQPISVIVYSRPITAYSPIVSEFGSAEEEAAYLAWLQEKVAASLADPRPPVPHDEVMAEMRAIIKKAGRKAS